MDARLWADVVIALFGLLGAGGGIKAFMGYRARVAERKKREREAHETQEAIECIDCCYSLMQRILVQTGATRVLLLRAENNGGIPAPDTKVFTTVIRQVYAPWTKDIRSDWQRVEVDVTYAKILRQMQHCDILRIKPQQVTGMLKLAYDRDKVSMTKAIGLGTVPNKAFLYIVINFREGMGTRPESMTDKDLFDLLSIRTQLMNCMAMGNPDFVPASPQTLDGKISLKEFENA